MLTTHRLRALPLIALALLGCATAPTVSPSAAAQGTGAPSARHAVDQFLAAVRAQDIQAISAVWGTSRGSTRDSMERTELERRAIIMQCYLSHSQFRVLSESAGEGGRQLFRVELTSGSLTRQTTFTTVVGPASRWYVENVDLASVRDLCSDAGTQPGR